MDTNIANYEVKLKMAPTTPIIVIEPIMPGIGNRMARGGMSFDTTVISVTASQLEFEIPEVPGGVSYNVSILSTVNGYAQMNEMEFEVDLGVTSISPASGSKGGGSNLTVTGHGFDTSGGKIKVTICGNECEIVGDVMTDTFNCLTPPDASEEDVTSCDVTIFQIKGRVFQDKTSKGMHSKLHSPFPKF